MNELAEKLMEIEKTAEEIVENAEKEKHNLEKYYQEKRDLFDLEAKKRTDETIAEIRDRYEQDMQEKLSGQQEANDCEIEFIRADYEKNREEYINELFDRIIEV